MRLPLGEKQKRINEFISKARNEEEKELYQIIGKFLENRGNRDATDVEVETIWEWVRNYQIDAALVGLILRGTMTLDVKDGEIYFETTAEGDEITAALLDEVNP